MRPVRIFVRSIRDAFKSVLRNFSLSIASILCTTITLILVSVAIISAANIENATKLIEDELSIVVYLDKSVTEEQIENIESDIMSQENVSEYTFKTTLFFAFIDSSYLPTKAPVSFWPFLI